MSEELWWRIVKEMELFQILGRVRRLILMKY
jgi:hypothetical protein